MKHTMTSDQYLAAQFRIVELQTSYSYLSPYTAEYAELQELMDACAEYETAHDAEVQAEFEAQWEADGLEASADVRSAW